MKKILTQKIQDKSVPINFSTQTKREELSNQYFKQKQVFSRVLQFYYCLTGL